MNFPFFSFVFTDLFEDLVGQEGPPLISPSLALLQRLWRHQRGARSLGFLCQQLNDHRLHVEEQHVHVRVCQVGLHRLDHKGIMGVFWQVALEERQILKNDGQNESSRGRLILTISSHN